MAVHPGRCGVGVGRVALRTQRGVETQANPFPLEHFSKRSKATLEPREAFLLPGPGSTCAIFFSWF